MPKDKLKLIYHTKGPKKGKLDKIIHKDYDFFFWDYEEQTKVKHMSLKAYFKVWSQILSKYHFVNYYDGFGGCGAYIDQESLEIGYGSPALAILSTVENATNNRCRFYISEKEEENIENLKKIINYNNLNPNNVFIEQGDFEEKINTFLDKLEKNPTPTFFMIDPYGINVSYKTLKRIMNIPKTEILFNFMFNYLNRFLTQENSAAGISELYGNDDWMQYKSLCGSLKEDALVELFRKRLKEFSSYVYQYRLSFADQDRTYYYLFHLTNEVKGCSIMKDAFASVNFGNIEFLGPNQPNPAQLCLIDQAECKIDNIKFYIFKNYKEQEITYENLLIQNIDNSPYLETQIRQAISSMENEYLEVKRIGLTEGGKIRTRGLKEKDLIKFYSEAAKVTKVEQQSLF